MMAEFENIMTELNRFEERVDALDYTIHSMISTVKLTNFSAIGGKYLGNWYWLSGADLFLYSSEQLKALGLSRQELKGKIDRSFFSERIHPEDLELFIRHFESFVAGNLEHDVLEYRMKTKDGSYKTFYNIIDVAMKNKSGKALVIEGKVHLISKSL